MFPLLPGWPPGLAHPSSQKPAFGKVRFIRARQARWHLERTAASGYTQQQLPPKWKTSAEKRSPGCVAAICRIAHAGSSTEKNPKQTNLQPEKSQKQVTAFPLLHFSGCCFVFPPSVLKLTLQKPCKLDTKPVFRSKWFWRLFLILTIVTERF